MNPIGKNLHLDISTSRPVLNVFPTSHPAVRLPLNLEQTIIIIIMFNHVCINNVKWKDTFSSYMRMSPPWGLCFIFLVEPTFAKYIFLNYCCICSKQTARLVTTDDFLWTLPLTPLSSRVSGFQFWHHLPPLGGSPACREIIILAIVLHFMDLPPQCLHLKYDRCQC